MSDKPNALLFTKDAISPVTIENTDSLDEMRALLNCQTAQPATLCDFDGRTRLMAWFDEDGRIIRDNWPNGQFESWAVSAFEQPATLLGNVALTIEKGNRTLPLPEPDSAGNYATALMDMVKQSN